MYDFVIEKCDFNSDDECDIYPIHQESNLDLKTAVGKVLIFAEKHPEGMLTHGNGRLIEYETYGAELSCYVDYTHEKHT